jgi:uncharacterized oxidoreductase
MWRQRISVATRGPGRDVLEAVPVPIIARDDLESFCLRLMDAAGVPPDHASQWASLLVEADVQGYPGHGAGHLASYLDRIKNGLINLEAHPRTVREGKTTAVIDADFAIGQVVATQAMDLAVTKAREHGVGIVAVRHSGHVGRLADYVGRAAASGMIGFATVSVGGGNVAPHGSAQPFAGTNPMAFGVPGRDGEHILLDFATATLSMGELQRDARRGHALPAGALLDGYGNPTTDYAAFIGPPRGALVAFGGHKGSGLHLMAEILGGLLSGNGRGRTWLDRGASAINGALFEAIDVEEFLPLEEFLDLVEELRGFVHSRTPRPGFGAVRLPGEGARRRAAEHLAAGIEIDEEDWAELVERAHAMGVALPGVMAPPG